MGKVLGDLGYKFLSADWIEESILRELDRIKALPDGSYIIESDTGEILNGSATRPEWLKECYYPIEKHGDYIITTVGCGVHYTRVAISLNTLSATIDC